MIILLLFTNPLLFFMVVVSIVFALTIHEYSHAQVADSLGDHTARHQGRLTINPLAHLDPFGTLLLLLVGFGWGRPVPFNPFNLRNQKWGPGLIALAGPFSNFLMATIVGLSLRFFEMPNIALVIFFSVFIWLNILLGVFNLMPIFPLDGSHILSALFPRFSEKVKAIFSQQPFLAIPVIILFMFFIIIPFVCRPLFELITGMPSPF
ncbi:MAG: site-2 protease family protein [Candidatus Pacebacteria bacterium]|nr:site-2 protease family protein [Candidatus Paceibacterota bacterium]